ncbi:MAG: hypothetical protein JJU29_22825 [Verrucomicrobia bacterium]|nr:hypothetical protein [Verrucomicrobiota bacterium]MCH8510830.1 hypothetical protein [Kiritimatiellia bacterium]
MIYIMKSNSSAEAFTLKVIGLFALLGGGAFALHALGTLLFFQETSGHNLVRNQLWGVGETLSLYFVLLPLIAVAGGSLRASTPGWIPANAGWIFLGLGGVFLVPAVLFGRMEHGWMFAMAYPGEAGRISPWQLTGILLAGLGVMCMMLRQIQVSWTLWRANGFLVDFLFGSAAVLVAIGMPLVASVAFYALMFHLLDFAVVDVEAGITLWMGGIPYAAALGMFHVAALLTLFGMLVHQAAPTYRPGTATKILLGAIPVLGLLAPELRVVPLHLPHMPVLSAMFAHCLLTAVWWAGIWRVLIEIQAEKTDRIPMYCGAIGGMLCLGIALGLVLNLLAFSGLHFFGGWIFLQRLVLGGGVLLACWMSLLPLRDRVKDLSNS